MNSYHDNWDGVKRKTLSFGEAVTKGKAFVSGRDYDRLTQNFLEIGRAHV